MSKKKVISFRILLVLLLKRHLKDDFRAKAPIFKFLTIFRAKNVQKSNFFQNFTHILLLKQHSGDDGTKEC